MREIKFRAWDSVNHKIVTSGLAINLDTTGRVIPVSFSQGDISYCRDNDVSKVPNIANEIQIMQYTGLKDENDVEIYEGDIYITDGDRDDCYQVMFVAGAFVGGKSSTSCMPLGWDGEEEDWPWERATIEVIGNIYENPELLEADQ